MNIELVLDARAAIGESPTWVPEENALYWVDIKAPALHRLDLGGDNTESWPLPADIGAFALDGAGRALVALRDGLYWLTLGTGALRLEAAAPFDPLLIRFNEGACDSRGRFWIGTMTDPPAGVESDITGLLYSFTAADGLVPHPDFAFITNGMAWNADETEFYLSHSKQRVIYKYPYDRDTGTLGGKTEFVRFADEPGIPDGAAIDAEGGYWCAVHGGGCLHRYAPDGVLDIIVDLPVSQPTMCCFAGADLATLYITSAREKLDDAALEQEPFAGGLFRCKPPVAGQRKYWKVG